MSANARPGRSDEAVREEAVAWLAKLRSGPNASEEAAFEDWYADDPRHAGVYDALLDNWDKMGTAALTPVGRMRARLTGRRGRGPRYIIAAAAAFLAVILAGAGCYRLGLLGAPTTEIASRVGEIRPVALPDGTQVTLDTMSAIRVAYSGSERRVALVKGRARFDVAHDMTRPFIVAAGASLVIAHGTLFDVALHHGGLTISLLRGSVEVRTSGDQANGLRESRRMLAPGQSMFIHDHAAPGPSSSINPDDTGWPMEMHSFNDESLEDVIAAVNRTGATRIVLADPSAAGARYTGTLAIHDPAAVAQMLAASYDLALSRDGRGDIVLGAKEDVQK